MLFQYRVLLELSLLTALCASFIILTKIKQKNKCSRENALKNRIREQSKKIDELNKTIDSLTSAEGNIPKRDEQIFDFLTNIVHELKTPLTVALGALKLTEQKLSQEPLDRQKCYDYLQAIKRNCYRLVRLVNNILDTAKIDSGYFKLNLAKSDLVYLVKGVTSSVFPYAEQKQLMLEFFSEEERIITAVDMEKIERAILNLLSNAIKFTNTGGKVSVFIKKETDKALISIKDTGIGIPKERQNELFNRFNRLDSPGRRGYEGSGIGLTLVKYYVELHNGRVYFDSEENRGSEFIIEIPVTEISDNEDILSPEIEGDSILDSVYTQFTR